MATNNAVNTTLAGQTGTGQFVGDTSPALITPAIGVATGTSLNLGASTTITGMIDDDTFATASASTAASSESIKAYVDATIGGGAGGSNGQIQYNNSGAFGGDSITTNGSGAWTGTLSLTGQLNVDNLRLDGNTFSSTNTDGNVNITPNGTGHVVVTTIDSTTSNPGNLRLTSNTLSSTDTNGDINLTPDGTGSVVIMGDAWDSLTNGQVWIGNTGNNPTAATLTPGTGVSIANGAGTITISTTGGGFGVATVAGTTQSAAVNTMYILLNAGQTTVTLPGTFSVGDTVILVGSGANTGGWIVDAPAGDTISVNGIATSSGGTITSSALASQCIELVADVANTSWVVVDWSGTLLTTA